MRHLDVDRHERRLARPAVLLAIVTLLWASFSVGQVARADTAVVPTSIDAKGRADVTDALNAFIGSVPNGSTVVFPAGARYRIEGTLLLENRHDLTVEGNGSTFFATTEGVRNRSHWRINTSSGITLRGIIVIGANENAGADGIFDATREAQHGFGIEGSDDVLLDDVEAYDVYGDFVYIDKHNGIPATNITVRNSRFSGSGRQGIAISSGEDVTIESNSIGEVRRSLIDLEPYNEANVIRRITIIDNDFGPARFYFLASAGRPATVEDVEVRGNRFTGMLPSVLVRGTAERPRERFTIADNVTDLTNNRATFSFGYVNGVTVTGNTVIANLTKAGIVVPGVETAFSCNIVVANNNFGGGIPLVTDGYRCGSPGPTPPK